MIDATKVREQIRSLRNLSKWNTMTNEQQQEDHVAWQSADTLESLLSRNEKLEAVYEAANNMPFTLFNGVVMVSQKDFDKLAEALQDNKE